MQDFQFLHSGMHQEGSEGQARAPIVIVEDDLVFNKTLKRWLEKKFAIEVLSFTSPNECLEAMATFSNRPFCLLSDISFSEESVDGLALIDMLRASNHHFVSLVMTGFASIETAITATKKGVFHYLTKPFELEALDDLIKRAFLELGVSLETPLKSEEERPPAARVFLKRFKIEMPTSADMTYGMVGRSQKMREIFTKIEKVAQTDSTVLINGASGTGKELVAKAIHNLSTRAPKKMVAVNCGAIPADLLESELFGHVKGAFTGAISTRKGRFETAHKGSIFLDEIGDMPLLLQVKLLRVLQTREIEPVGSNETFDVDVRIITATHRDLEKLVVDGKFREDLFYRLNVIPVRVPELKERREDIPLLIGYFLNKFVSADGRNALIFDDEVLEILMGHQWPGNVRELENLMERMVILKGGGRVTVSDLPSKYLTGRPASFLESSMISLPEDGVDLKEILDDIEDSLIMQALERTDGNRNQASKLLRMNRTTLIEKLRKKGMLFP